MLECKFCNQEFSLASGLIRHISKTHKISPEDYYLQINHLSEVPRCKICGGFVKFINAVKGYRTFCSAKCEMQDKEVIEKSKNTNIARYGMENPMASDIVRNKIVSTNIAKYGVAYPVMSKKIRNKGIQTCINRYGTDNPLKCNEIKDKATKTCLNKFGTATPFENNDIRSKAKDTIIQKYGVDNVFKSDIIKEKIKSTNISKYGADKPFRSNDIQNKCKSTFKELYGGNSPMIDPEIRSKSRKRYTYDGLQFDSSWEVAFYIFHKDAGHDISLHPKKGFKYYYKSEEHWYFPDFIVDGKYYEIKGTQFFDSDGNLINPYDSSKNEQWKYKLKCMQDNNIMIITDCTEFIRYVQSTYGKDYLANFRNS